MISTTNLTKHYGDQTAVHNLTAKAGVANLSTFEYKEIAYRSLAPFIVLGITIGLFGLGFISNSSRKVYAMLK